MRLISDKQKEKITKRTKDINFFFKVSKSLDDSLIDEVLDMSRTSARPHPRGEGRPVETGERGEGRGEKGEGRRERGDEGEANKEPGCRGGAGLRAGWDRGSQPFDLPTSTQEVGPQCISLVYLSVSVSDSDSFQCFPCLSLSVLLFLSISVCF